MEVILKEDVKGLGKSGEIVKVNDGYARNFLLPSKKAVPATDGNAKMVKEQARKKQEKAKQEDDLAAAAAGKLSGVEITVKKKASEDNKLFGSVSESDIADELKKLGHQVEKSNIRLEKHIKEPGLFRVAVHFKGEAEAQVKVKVIGENDKKAD
jgi:large subunit ribosomal protein L9